MSKTRFAQAGVTLWPVYELRPLPAMLREHAGEVYRYATGQWIPDDGEWDVAFACLRGVPTAVYVDLPFQRNIVWSWLTRSWWQDEPLHPLCPAAKRGRRVLRWSRNPWHYQLREGTTDWGGEWGRDHHPNRLAQNAAMAWVANRRRCASGTGPKWSGCDLYVPAGLVRERESRRIVLAPTDPPCMYCGLAWRDAIEREARTGGDHA